MKKTKISLACLLVIPMSSFADSSWKAFDKDKDNALNLSEFAGYKAALYAELDMNEDGKWSRSEFVKGLRDIKGIDPHWLREKFKRLPPRETRQPGRYPPLVVGGGVENVPQHIPIPDSPPNAVRTPHIHGATDCGATLMW